MLVTYEPLSQTVAQIIGKAKEITEANSINAVANTVFRTSMKMSRGGIVPIPKLEDGDYVAFKIIPVQIRLASYERPDSGEYSDIFESLESFELKPNS